MIARAMSDDHELVMTPDAYQFLRDEFGADWVKSKFFITVRPLSLPVIKDIARCYREMESDVEVEATPL